MDKALSVSEEYLRNASDVDDIFQDSTKICLGLAKEIMTFVNDTQKGKPKEAAELKEMRSRLGKTFARMESRWENLLQEARENQETVEFTKLEELVKTARIATEDAMLGSRATIQELLSKGTQIGGANSTPCQINLTRTQ